MVKWKAFVQSGFQLMWIYNTNLISVRFCKLKLICQNCGFKLYVQYVTNLRFTLRLMIFPNGCKATYPWNCVWVGLGGFYFWIPIFVYLWCRNVKEYNTYLFSKTATDSGFRIWNQSKLSVGGFVVPESMGFQYVFLHSSPFKSSGLLVEI